jgi:hypothetical protein
MPPGTAPPAKRRRLDRNSTLQQPQQSFERTFANGNSRNVYGNIYNAPVSYTGVPVENLESETDDTQIGERLHEALNFDEREDRLATIGKAHEETCQWLFERDEYKAWRDPDKRHIHHGFFWIKGKPGTGKSTLMKCAYNRGLKEFPDDVIVSFFFNARGAQLQQSTEGMYRSLLCQLLEQMPHLAARLPRRECERLQKPGWPVEMLKNMLRDALLLVDSARLTCYVDALDECQDEDARDMIDFFDTLATSAAASNISLHILLSSRHYPQIDISRCQKLILERQPDHGSDIAKYIQSKLQIGSSVTARDIKRTLLRKASGVFLWVVLVVQILNEHKRRGLVHELKQRVDDIPKDLDKLFAEILQGGSSELPYTFSMLQLIAFASRPLTREEVYHAALYSDSRHETTSLIDVTQEDMEHFILNCSKGLAEMTKGMYPTVQLIHESVRNHLLDTGLKTAVPASCDNLPAWCHENLKALCLGYVKKSALVLLRVPNDGLKEHLPDHFARIKELKSQTSTAHPFLNYALDGMISHAQQAYSAGCPQDVYMRLFPLGTWIRVHNILAVSHDVRLSGDATLAYILVTKGASELVKVIIGETSWRSDVGNIASNERHSSLLGAATDRGDYEVLDRLLKVGVPPDSKAKDGQSCLSLAISRGEVAICRRLMAAGAKVNNMSTRDRPSDLRLANESGCLEIVRALLQHPQYARHLESSFENDLRFAIRRYAESTGHSAALLLLLDAALERPDEKRPRSQSPEADTHVIYKAAQQAACQRADITIINWTINQGVIPDHNTLKVSIIAGKLDVIDLLLGLRQDIEPSRPEVLSDLDFRDSKFIQLLLDQAENTLDTILDATYPRFSTFRRWNIVLPWPSPVTAHSHTSLPANPRDIRFAKVFPMAVYHGDSWGSVLKCLLDKKLTVSNRESYMDTALQCACYLHHSETLQTLLDWCQDFFLKSKLLPGVGKGLVILVDRYYIEGSPGMIQRIWDSKFNVHVDMFCKAYYDASRFACQPYPHSYATECHRILLAWAVERSRRDAVFATALAFVPTGGADDQQRLERHLRTRQSLKQHE